MNWVVFSVVSTSLWNQVKRARPTATWNATNQIWRTFRNNIAQNCVIFYRWNRSTSTDFWKICQKIMKFRSYVNWTYSCLFPEVTENRRVVESISKICYFSNYELPLKRTSVINLSMVVDSQMYSFALILYCFVVDWIFSLDPQSRPKIDNILRR